MPTAKIQVINESTCLTDAQVSAAVPDLQIQITRDFAPIWGEDATLSFVAGGGKNADPTQWWCVILDDSDQAGALGYHDLTTTGLPIAKIFAKSDLEYNLSWTVTTSHELLEMLGDPFINMSAYSQERDGSLNLYCYEACDACEDDQFAYKINQTLVSDFVTPDWFGNFAGTKFDFRGFIHKPLQLLAGGYIGKWDENNGWTQITAQKGMARLSDHRMSSRRERRLKGHHNFLRSVLV
jgi:hypothetical protein